MASELVIEFKFLNSKPENVISRKDMSSSVELSAEVFVIAALEEGSCGLHGIHRLLRVSPEIEA